MDLDRVVLSGPAFAEAGPIYLAAAQEAVSQLSFMRQVHPVTIELSQLGLRSAAIGAATVALDANLLTRDRDRDRGRSAPPPAGRAPGQRPVGARARGQIRRLRPPLATAGAAVRPGDAPPC